MRYFGNLDEDQLVSGLGAAASGILVLPPIAVSDALLLRGRHNIMLAAIAVAIVALPTTYITAKVLSARSGSLRVSPNVSFALTTCSTTSLVFAQFSSHTWAGNAFVAMMILTTTLTSLGGSRSTVAAGATVQSVAMGIALLSDHYGVKQYLMVWWLFASANWVVALMVSMTAHRLYRRSRSGEALAEIADVAGRFDTVDDALVAIMPMVADVIRCDRVTSAMRPTGSSGEARVLGLWERSSPKPRGTSQGSEVTAGGRGTTEREVEESIDVPSSIGMGSGSLVEDDRCVIPVGYRPEGELFLVLESIDTRRVLPNLLHATAEALASTVLHALTRIEHVVGLRHESRTDPLTGLANRRVLEERLEVALAQAKRTHRPVVVAMIDLDHFKRFNDEHGHQLGDELLRVVSARMSDRLRQSDLLARYGGEEFCLILPDTGIDDAVGLLESIRTLVKATEVGAAATSVSVGCAQWDGAESLESLIGRADGCLYRAKSGGRDRVVAAEHSMA